MARYSFASIALMLAGVLLVTALDGRAEMAGSAGRASNYVGMLDLGNGDRCDLSIQVERVSFLLTTVANKYRLVRMLVDCRKQTGLTLSSTADRLEIAIENRQVPAVLSLQRSDSAVWDALDLNMRQTLAYPPAIKPNAPVYVFAYFPADQVNTIPARFTFTIASLGRAVTLQVLATAARA
jgi:hypothetical protein